MLIANPDWFSGWTDNKIPVFTPLVLSYALSAIGLAIGRIGGLEILNDST